MSVNRRTLVGATLLAAATPSASAQTATYAEIEPLRRPASGNIRVAFLIDRFHNIIDLAGPWETFASAGSEEQHFELYTVSPVRETLHLGGVKVTPDYTFADAPAPHVVVMGAQGGARMGEQDTGDTQQPKLAWLRQVAPNADVLLSVCTGAFVLAATGLIDGRVATTHHDYYEDFARAYPNVRLVRDRRFVDNGKYVSAGGLTSGIDAALHVVARYYSADEATTVARYLEHDGDGWRTGVRTPA